MKPIADLVFKRKTFFYFFLACILIGGVFSYFKISKLEDPIIIPNCAKVVTIYPGATAHEVELQVATVLENKLNLLPDVEKVITSSQNNVCMTTIYLSMEVPPEEYATRWQQLRNKVDEAATEFPAGVRKPIVYDDFADIYGMFYAMTGDGFTYEEMYKQACNIRTEMLRVKGVSRVQIYGMQYPTVDIVISNEKMSELGISPYQIISTLSKQNATVYPGVLQTDGQRIPIAVDDKIQSEEDVKNLLIKSFTGEMFPLSAIAEIKRGYADPMKNTFTYNNQPALGIAISMENEENILNVGDRVEEKLAELQQNIPLGYEFNKVFFQPDKVRESINGFIINLIESVLIVILVLMITMGIRSGIILGIGLILTILATFPLLYATGGSLQRISLGSFIVAMGMLVDNAIVVMDGINVDLRRKKRRSKYVYTNQAKRTALPLLGATLIAITAFLPVFLSPDTAGTYIRDLFIVLCISLLFSWLLAQTQIPMMAAQYVRPKEYVTKEEEQDPYQGKFYDIFRAILRFALNNRIVTLSLALALLCVTLIQFKGLKQAFFPDFNYNQVYIEYLLPDGTSPEKVQSDMAKITDYFLSLDEVEMVVTSQGMTPARYCLVRSTGEIADNYGELIVNFKDYQTMAKMRPVLAQYLADNYPDAKSRVRKYNLSIKSTHAVEVCFLGPDPAVLKQLSAQAEEIMRNCPLADYKTVCNDWQPMGKSMHAAYEQSIARRTGTSRSDLSNMLLACTDGLPLATYYEGEIPVNLSLKVRDPKGNRIENLNDISVWNMLPDLTNINKQSIMDVVYGKKDKNDIARELLHSNPINAVSSGIELDWNESVVNRAYGKRAIEAQCDPIDGYNPTDVRNYIKKDIEQIQIPEGYTMEWLGEYDLQNQALKNIIGLLPVAVVLIIFILIMLFNDFKRPIIVLLCIPFAAIGIVPALLLANMPFDFVAIVGAMGLMGMLIKNAIVLLDDIRYQEHHGFKGSDAIIRAGVNRVLPVLMTSVTTMLGVLPLIADPMYKTMAVTIIGGLLVGTLITLILLPIFYSFFYRVTRPKNVKTVQIAE